MKYLKDDKSLTKHIINIMVKNKKTELRIPQLLENDELLPDYFNHTGLSEGKKKSC
jgi:hypothetical protein